MDNASRVTSDYWAGRIDDAATDHAVMGEAWSYLLASIRAAVCTEVQLNEIRRAVAAYLIDTAEQEDLR